MSAVLNEVSELGQTEPFTVQSDAQSTMLDVVLVTRSPYNRTTFNPKKLAEMVESVRRHGVMQPVLVRPLPPTGFESAQQYELVAGERRWLAARTVGLMKIPAVIRTLTDVEVLELQLTENLQREDMTALQEADGFHQLLEAHRRAGDNFGAKQLATKLGKSRGYVYARLKLRDVAPEVRAAMESGELDASKALLIARWRSHKLQVKALKRAGGEWHTARQLADALRRDFTKSLAAAPFPLDDDKLGSANGDAKIIRKYEPMPLACTACEHNSANDPELQEALGEDCAHVCTHTGCYDYKVMRFWSWKKEQAKRDGRTVLTGEEAVKVLPGRYAEGLSATHLDLDAKADMDFPEEEPGEAAGEEAYDAYEKRASAWTAPTDRQLLYADRQPAEAVLAEDPKSGTLRELLPLKEARKLLKPHGIELQTPREMHTTERAARDPEAARLEREKEERRQAIELGTRRRLLAEIHAKWKGDLKREEWEWLLEFALNALWGDSREALEKLYGGTIVIPKVKDAEFPRLVALACAADGLSNHGAKPGRLLYLAGRFKIDPKKIRTAVTAELDKASKTK